MLDRAHRLTTSAGFAAALRSGRRVGGATLVVHLGIDAVSDDGVGEARIGFVVNRSVGNAVTRNLVKRRLRHLARERVALLPPSGVLVVRALPAAAVASYAELGHELDRGLRRALDRLEAGTTAGAGSLR